MSEEARNSAFKKKELHRNHPGIVHTRMGHATHLRSLLVARVALITTNLCPTNDVLPIRPCLRDEVDPEEPVVHYLFRRAFTGRYW